MKQPMEKMVEQLHLFRLKYLLEHFKDDTSTPNFSHGQEVESSSVTTQKGVSNTVLNDSDRLQVQSVTNFSQRRESFLYRSDSEAENSQPPRSSRHSSVSSEGIHGDELVTPFAQVLSSLKSVRSNFVLLTNIRQNRLRRGSEGFHLNSRLCQLYEINDGSMIRDDMYKKLTMETLKEFDWCLDQLDTLRASMSISEMASNKFKRLLDRELKDFSETGGSEISAWVFDNFVDKSLESLPNKDSRKLRARSKSLVKSLKKLSRSVSCSGSVPRFGAECKDEETLEQIFNCVDTWDFDVFKLAEYTGNRPLMSITYTILQTRDLLKMFKIKPWVFSNYITLVESHYIKDIPFHNSTHAADVVHATHVLLSSGAFEGVFTDLEILAALIAAAVHDVDHPGVNNNFLVNSSSEMALLYNDESVLENHHLAVAFQLMQGENCDILESFSKAERQQFRKMVIEMVLATDNAKHMNILGSLKTMVETKKLSEQSMRPVQLESTSEKMHVLKCLVHCADLSNPTRPLPMYETWVERLMEEFFRQGDVERDRKMEISPMMDRHNANIEKSQVVFIDYVVHPLWETWADLVYPDAQPILNNLQTNREYYRSRCPQSPSNTPAATPNSSPFPPRKSMPAAVDTTKTKNIIAEHQKKANRNSLDSDSNTDTDEPSTADRAFLVRNDIKLFQNESNANNNNPNSYMIIDRRRSDTDALNAMSDVKLVRQKLLKYAHVKSQDSTDIDNHQDSKNLHQTQNSVLNNNTRTTKEIEDGTEDLKIEDAE
ncbi:3',5'-cyclic-AMP phosphodiesterase 4C-like isoform X2 [Clytia hemisphaerica]|uniref:Phosphodiesterase n=1 Tax=Clytia hemisphaerica TaxID=252671 RepID=A0A7M5TV21_9CNID